MVEKEARILNFFIIKIQRFKNSIKKDSFLVKTSYLNGVDSTTFPI